MHGHRAYQPMPHKHHSHALLSIGTPKQGLLRPHERKKFDSGAANSIALIGHPNITGRGYE